MEVLLEYCLDCLVTVLFEMIRHVVPEWCLSHSDTCKFYPRVGGIPATKLSLRERKNSCNRVWLDVTIEWGISRLRSYVVEVVVWVSLCLFKRLPEG